MKNNNISIPELSLVVLIGTSGSGKSTFAKKHFLGTEVISSDWCRALVDDDENSKNATQDAFDLVHFMVRKRLKRGKLTVVDATNLRPEDRKQLIEIAKEYHVFPVAIMLSINKKIAYERNSQRPERAHMGKHVIRSQWATLRQYGGRLKKEGFRYIYELKTEEAVNAITLNRRKLWNNKKEEHGPFDIIGDVHGCFEELRALLTKLGYKITKHRDQTKNYGYTVKNPTARKAIFVGDLVDRGPASNEVLRLVMSMVKNEQALCVLGNHDDKLKRKLMGNQVQIKHGLAETLEQLATEPAKFIDEVKNFLSRLISHYILDNGKLCIAHAGLREEMQGRGSAAVRSFALYGETTGEVDEFGLPVRYNWAKEYNGKAMVVYGHTPVLEATWLNNTMDIDTGCVFGGKLSALRYPERTIVSVPAQKEYAVAKRPMQAPKLPDDGMLHIEDVLGKRIIETQFSHPITIREEHTAAALEVISRFAVNPKWLVYLPPTMSPCATSLQADFLEHPIEALQYYQEAGIQQVICEEKHMGSRAVLILGKNKSIISTRFGIENDGIGRILTRTGRAFFEDKNVEQALLERLRDAMTKADFWNTLKTDWVVLDAELMPWSAKALKLIEEQYAAVGTIANSALEAVTEALAMGNKRHPELEALSEKMEAKKVLNDQFIHAYRNYCWEINGLEDYKIAPFHVLATEGQTHFDKDHLWHMETIKSFCTFDRILMATAYKVVDFSKSQSIDAAINWWSELTEKGGEGMVVKPLQFIAKNEKGLLQPAVKCRGKEYLRIIYGADYTLAENLVKLKKRGLGKKRSLALKEFSLGLEALNRFVNEEPLRKVHECVFGVLALESEPVDPRL